MPIRTKPEPIQADAGLAQALKFTLALKKLKGQHHGHGHAEQTVREDHYNGHHIVIKTTYEVRVDGKKFSAALGVSNGGNVQYHGIPNVGFASAVDLIRCVIDQFPEEFPRVASAKPNGHAAHGHGASHGARKQTKPRVKKAAN